MSKAKSKSKKGSGKSNRSESRRFASKVSFGIIVVGAMIALVAVANKWTAREELRSIIIEGNLVLDTTEVLKQAALSDSVSVKSIDLEEVEERLIAHPFIAGAVAWEGGSGSLVLEVKERAPLAVTIIGDEPVYLDAQAVPLPYRFGIAAPDVPVLGGMETDGVLDSSKVMEAMEVANTLRNYNDLLYRQIAEIRRDDEGVYTLRLTDGGVPVIAGEPEDIAPRLPKLEAFLEQVVAHRGAGELRQIDLRWSGQVVVRPKS